MDLKEWCGVCSSMKWCGRQCRNAPGQNVQKPKLDPWDEDYAPPKPPKKEEPKPVSVRKTKQAHPQTIRFPQKVLDHFGYKTPGWQSRINDVLLKHARENEK